MLTLNVDNGLIHPCYLKDGQIAVMVEHFDRGYVGRIVQRLGNDLISVGGSKGNVWGGMCHDKVPMGTMLVRALENGETLTIEGNE